MEKQFTEKELIAFGNYLLSDDRKRLIIDHPLTKQDPSGLNSRLKSVSDADIQNFAELNILTEV